MAFRFEGTHRNRCEKISAANRSPPSLGAMPEQGGVRCGVSGPVDAQTGGAGLDGCGQWAVGDGSVALRRAMVCMAEQLTY